MIYRFLSSNLTFAGLMALTACLAFIFVPRPLGIGVGLAAAWLAVGAVLRTPDDGMA